MGRRFDLYNRDLNWICFQAGKMCFVFFSSVRLLVRFKSSQGKSPFVHFSTQIKYNCHMTHIFDPVYVQFIFSVYMHWNRVYRTYSQKIKIADIKWRSFGRSFVPKWTIQEEIGPTSRGRPWVKLTLYLTEGGPPRSAKVTGPKVSKWKVQKWQKVVWTILFDEWKSWGPKMVGLKIAEFHCDQKGPTTFTSGFWKDFQFWPFFLTVGIFVWKKDVYF